MRRRRNENHGLSSCRGSTSCSCGGTCSEDTAADERPYVPAQTPGPIPGYEWDVKAGGYRRVETP